MTGTGPLVRLEIGGGVATVTLDAPASRNALSSQLLAGLREALVSARDDGAVRVIVLTGAGPAFCAGADLRERHEAGAPALPAALPEILTLIWDSPEPVIARVNGAARAGGIGLIAACDIAVAAEEATFGFSEVRIGVIPAVISVMCLRRMEPRAAHEYFLTGETFGAARAAEIGLLNRAVPAAELDATVERYACLLLRGAPGALAAAKDLTRTVPVLPVGEGFRQMTELSARWFGSAEAREGIAAFREKRDPAWVPASRRNA
jgi:methylglutaconyl-CoA hydratase